ncbi:matrixin family metalloprotease [Nitrospira lenta]|uniref:Peptidase M10 metallopeptidase domain-containing protein n=1 Tax=Nitrospira lenta TaxID=1436998 RepID=A0A330L667_9BACT|nr:hypothetical protein NITLEN_30253 [Nitrospira lenta]
MVNQVDAFGSGFLGLTSDQLALLNQATITIADLADGYLALTSGTTITLDTDAAGYGWFIDSTPLTNEEFVVGANPWQFTALEGRAAAGKIDLMTVLMHELGHVMGLDHVSSAVDGTRLMAGSIDPGIRRLPSALDLGAVASSTEPGTGTGSARSQSPDPSPGRLRSGAPRIRHPDAARRCDRGPDADGFAVQSPTGRHGPLQQPCEPLDWRPLRFHVGSDATGARRH